MRKSQKIVFSIQYAHVEAGKSAFSIYMEKVGNSLKFNKFTKILGISINVVGNQLFCPRLKGVENTVRIIGNLSDFAENHKLLVILVNFIKIHLI